MDDCTPKPIDRKEQGEVVGAVRIEKMEELPAVRFCIARQYAAPGAERRSGNRNLPPLVSRSGAAGGARP